MKKFTYQYSDLQHDVLTNSDRTNLKFTSDGMANFIPPDDLLEDAIVPEITYTETNATSVDKTVKAWTYYCDSLSGCDSSSPHYKEGNGSKENPWRSLDYAVKMIREKLTCWRNNTCCYDPYRKGKYFQLKVKGTIDYVVNYYLQPEFRGAENVDNQWVQQFIISPWDSNQITFESGDFFSAHIYGTILNNIKIKLHYPYQSSDTFYGYGDSIFNHVTIEVVPQTPWREIFNSCHGAKFIDVRKNSELGNEEVLFNNCIGSDLIGFTGNNIGLNGGLRGRIYNASVTIADNSDEIYKEITGVKGFYDCSFFNCSANVSGTLTCNPYETQCYNEYTGAFYPCTKYYGYVDACGFYDNSECTFYNCSTTNICQKCADETHECRTPDF